MVEAPKRRRMKAESWQDQSPEATGGCLKRAAANLGQAYVGLVVTLLSGHHTIRGFVEGALLPSMINVLASAAKPVHARPFERSDRGAKGVEGRAQDPGSKNLVACRAAPTDLSVSADLQSSVRAGIASRKYACHLRGVLGTPSAQRDNSFCQASA
jgi:hypothetical protein